MNMTCDMSAQKRLNSLGAADFVPSYDRYGDLPSFQDAWSRDHFNWNLMPSKTEAYEGALFCRRHQDVIYSDIIFGAVSAERDVNHIGSCDKYIGINLFIQGQADIRQFDSVERVNAGDVFLWDVSSPTQFRTWNNTRCLNIFMPRSILASKAFFLDHFFGHKLGVEHALSPLLLSHLLTLHKMIDGLSEGRRDDALRMTLDILSNCFKSNDMVPDARSQSKCNFVRVMKLIDENLADEGFSATKCADLLGMSDRYMRKVLAQFGATFSSYIRKRRLECAAHALRTPVFALDSVTTIAGNFGFSDPSYFARVFLKEFGLSPSAYRLAECKVEPNSV